MPIFCHIMSIFFVIWAKVGNASNSRCVADFKSTSTLWQTREKAVAKYFLFCLSQRWNVGAKRENFEITKEAIVTSTR